MAHTVHASRPASALRPRAGGGRRLGGWEQTAPTVVGPPRPRRLVHEHAVVPERVAQVVGCPEVAVRAGSLPTEEHREDLLVGQGRAARRRRANHSNRWARGRSLAQAQRVALQLTALELDDRLVALAAKAERYVAMDMRLAPGTVELHAFDCGIETREERLDLFFAHLGSQPRQAQPRRRALAGLLLPLAPAARARAHVEHLVDVPHRARARGIHFARHLRVPGRRWHLGRASGAGPG
eukprot:scaffold13737_cov95-Isochrysis_galbana.AAC.2